MGAVFAMQGFGQLCAAIVMICLVAGFKGSLQTATSYATCSGACSVAVDRMWRFLIGFGAVPACIALYYRLTIPETPRYTFDVARDVEKARDDVTAYIAGRSEGKPDEVSRAQGRVAGNETMTVPKASFRDWIRYYATWKNGKILLGTAGSWFFLDVAYYGVSLNTPIILSAIGYSGGPNVFKILLNLAVGNMIVVLAGAIPGYWVTVALVDTIGRKPIQIGGFAILTGLFCAFGFAYDKLSGHGLLAIYVAIQFFFNFGPNSTTFIVPGECFPTRYRSSSHGFSAASGKLGAIIAQACIAPLRTRGAVKGATGTAASPWMNHVLEIFALFMFMGIITSFCIPETKRKTLEELNGEEIVAESSESEYSTEYKVRR